MSRNFGFEIEREHKMYTLKEFKDGCHFNLFLGAMVGVVFTLGAELLFVWTYGV